MNWIWTNMCKSTTEKVPIACCKAPKSNEIAQINFLKRENSNVYKFCIAKTRTRIDGILCIYQNSIVRTHNKTQCLANKSSIFHLLQKFCLRINCTSISLHSVGLDEFSYCFAANFCGLFWSSQLKLLFGFAEYTCLPYLKWCKYPMDERERERRMISSVCTSTRVKSMNFCTHKISYYILASLQFRFIKLDLKMFSIRILRMSSFTLSVTHAHSNSLMCYIVCGVRCVCLSAVPCKVHRV